MGGPGEIMTRLLAIAAILAVLVATGWVTLPTGLPHPTPEQIGAAVTWVLRQASR